MKKFTPRYYLNFIVNPFFLLVVFPVFLAPHKKVDCLNGSLILRILLNIFILE